MGDFCHGTGSATHCLCFNFWNDILWLLMFCLLTVYLWLVSGPMFSRCFCISSVPDSVTTSASTWCHASCFILIVHALCQCILLCLCMSDLSQLYSHLIPILSCLACAFKPCVFLCPSSCCTLTVLSFALCDPG